MNLSPLLPPPLERDTQKAIVKLFEAVGCIVYRTSQGYRRDSGGTRMTPGIPDLWVICPRRQVAWWFEVKRPSGKRTQAQVQFAVLCAATHTRYAWGGVNEAKNFLSGLGLLEKGAA